MYFRRTMSSGWGYEGDLERNVLLCSANAGLLDPCRLGLSGLPRVGLDDRLSSPSSGMCDWLPAGARCIEGLSNMSPTSSSSSSSECSWSSSNWNWTRPCCRLGRNWSLIVGGRDVRRKGLGRRPEGLEGLEGGWRGDSVPAGVKTRSPAVESLLSDAVIHAVEEGIRVTRCSHGLAEERTNKSGAVNHAIRGACALGGDRSRADRRAFEIVQRLGRCVLGRVDGVNSQTE